MGLFDKIKNILFEEDDEDTMTDIPVYNKKEIKEEKIVEPVKDIKPVINDDKTSQIDNSRFKNVKRDIDLSFSDEEESPKVNPDVQHTRDIVDELKRDVSMQREERKHSNGIEDIKLPEDKPLPQRRSVFQSFDAEEFDRQNARSNELELKRREEFRKREEAMKKEKEERISMNEARMANNNFSSTTPTRKESDPEKYKISEHQGKKPFRPSPVISPVYGILDKNYTADEIVDKTDGMKREKVNTIVRTPDIEAKPKTDVKTIDEAFTEYDEEEKEINIDSVRDKAYGKHEEVIPEEYVIEEKDDTIMDDIAEVIDEINEEEDVLPEEVIEEEMAPLLDDDLLNIQEEESDEDLISKFVRDETPKKDKETATLIVDEPLYIPEEDYEEEEDEDTYEGDSLLDVDNDNVNKAHILDDMEKTSTLQILDDIEKELNSIKSVATPEDNDELTYEDRLERNDTLENDLFNLIDSMYDNGEEDEDND